jgi:hypothetical protein
LLFGNPKTKSIYQPKEQKERHKSQEIHWKRAKKKNPYIGKRGAVRRDNRAQVVSARERPRSKTDEPGNSLEKGKKPIQRKETREQ